MSLAAQILLHSVQFVWRQFDHGPAINVLLHGIPETLQETETSLHAIIRPFQRLLGRRREHHEQPHRIGTVLPN